MIVAGLVEDPVQKLVNRQVVGHGTITCELRTEVIELRLQRRGKRRLRTVGSIGLRCLRQRSPEGAEVRDELRQLLVRELVDRRVEDGGQRDVLLRIVDDIEKGQHGLHLDGIEVALVAGAVGRHTIRAEDLHKGIRPGARGAKQDHHIAVLHTVGMKALDPLGDHVGLSLLLRHLRTEQLLRRLLRDLEQQKLCLVARIDHLAFRHLRVAIVKRHLLVVVDAAQHRTHHAVEHAVDRTHHLVAAPEVPAQLDLRIVRILIFHKEEIRARLTEAVDGLLHVPDLEDIRTAEARRRKGTDQLLLHEVRVLILVHQDLPILLCDIIGDRRRMADAVGVRGIEDLQRLMLKITEVEHMPLFLLLLVTRAELLREAHEALHAALDAGLHPRLGLRIQNDRQPGDVLRILLHIVTDRRHAALQCGFRRPQSLIADRLGPENEFLKLRRFRCIPEGLLFLCHIREIAFRAIRLCTDGQRIVHPLRVIAETRGELLQEKLLSIRRFRRETGIEVLLRPRVGGCALVQLLNQLCDARVGLSLREGVDEVEKILFARRILLLQQILEDIALQKPELALVSHAEARVEVDRRIVFRDEMLTEGIDGGDARVLNAPGLTDQLCAVRMLPELLLECRLDTIPHLLGRCLREGHDHHLGQLHRIHRGHDPGNHMLHEHRGLTGACRRSDQQIPRCMIDYTFLFSRPLHRSSPLVKSRSRSPLPKASPRSGRRSRRSAGRSGRYYDTDTSCRPSYPY